MRGANVPRSLAIVAERVAPKGRPAACRDERGSILVLSALLIPSSCC